ncbi:MAG: hypothetical protein QOI58_3477 [Thermoanaerobaculia bacterium]|nr:hypothetical protein [Thermoanaerobaculia bacterium]
MSIESREQVMEQRFHAIEMCIHALRLVVDQSLHVGQRDLAMKAHQRLKKIVPIRGAVG